MSYDQREKLHERDLSVADVGQHPHETRDAEPISEASRKRGSHQRSLLLQQQKNTNYSVIFSASSIYLVINI